MGILKNRATKDWASRFTSSKGVQQVLAKGLMASKIKHYPSGISSFLFEEKTDQVRVSAEAYAQIIRATYGSKGISESSLRAMMDMSMNPPKNVDDAHRRVRSVVSAEVPSGPAHSDYYRLRLGTPTVQGEARGAGLRGTSGS